MKQIMNYKKEILKKKKKGGNIKTGIKKGQEKPLRVMETKLKKKKKKWKKI